VPAFETTVKAAKRLRELPARSVTVTVTLAVPAVVGAQAREETLAEEHPVGRLE
jgi:hypothetical protein